MFCLKGPYGRTDDALKTPLPYAFASSPQNHAVALLANGSFGNDTRGNPISQVLEERLGELVLPAEERVSLTHLSDSYTAARSTNSHDASRLIIMVTHDGVHASLCIHHDRVHKKETDIFFMTSSYLG